MSGWRDRAKAEIARLTRDLPGDATVQQRRKALWGKGYPAHAGTSWGRKIWGKEVRAYLARHGAQREAEQMLPTGKYPAQLHFPFRSSEAPQ